LLPRLLPRIESGSRIWNSSNLSSLFFFVGKLESTRASDGVGKGREPRRGRGGKAGRAGNLVPSGFRRKQVEIARSILFLGRKSGDLDTDGPTIVPLDSWTASGTSSASLGACWATGRPTSLIKRKKRPVHVTPLQSPPHQHGTPRSASRRTSRTCRGSSHTVSAPLSTGTPSGDSFYRCGCPYRTRPASHRGIVQSERALHVIRLEADTGSGKTQPGSGRI
jgi:hypothetical protein